jgi:hypothetical protein
MKATSMVAVVPYVQPVAPVKPPTGNPVQESIARMV